MMAPRLTAEQLLGMIDWQMEVSGFCRCPGEGLHTSQNGKRDCRVLENRLKAGLEVFGCDPKVFTYSQPVRVPGAWREGKLQRLIWLRE